MAHRILFRGVLLAAVSLLGLSVRGHAQALPSGSSQQDTEAVRTNTQLVQTDVSVFDHNGKFVEDLTREQFELRVNGTPRQILFFERVKAGSPDEEAQIRAAVRWLGREVVYVQNVTDIDDPLLERLGATAVEVGSLRR